MSQNTSSATQSASSTPSSERLPWAGLLALAMTGFICILTETIPAGLLLQIGEGLESPRPLQVNLSLCTPWVHCWRRFP